MIGLVGRKGAGKDTAAAVLVYEGYANEKFAGALKAMLRTVLSYQGVDAETIERMIEGDLKETPTKYLAGRTPRHAMQTLGTEWGRDQIGEEFWVGTVFQRVAVNTAKGLKTVLTDTRFPNEVEAIETLQGDVFGIVADWITPTIGEHPSEAMIDEIIAALPEGRVVRNFKATSHNIPKAIKAFRERFKHALAA